MRESEYLEGAIYHFRTLLPGTSFEDPVRRVIIEELARLQDICHSIFSGTSDHRDTHFSSSDLSSLASESFQDLSVTLSQSGGDSLLWK